jgi:hypothetical protein
MYLMPKYHGETVVKIDSNPLWLLCLVFRWPHPVLAQMLLDVGWMVGDGANL